MNCVIVPDYVHSAITAKLDAAYAKCPDAEPCRPTHYRVLLAYFDEHGELPDFDLQKKVPA